MSNRLLTFAAVLFGIGLLSILWVLYRTILGMRQRAPGQPAPKRTATSVKVAVFLVGIILVAASQLSFWLDDNLSFFAVVDDSELIGKLKFELDSSGSRQAVLSLRRSDGASLIPYTIPLESGTLILEAELIRFSHSYSMLGLGEFGRVAAVRTVPSAEDSSGTVMEKRVYQDADEFWSKFDRLNNILPGVETLKFLSEPIPFETGAERLISVSQAQLLLSK